MSPSAHIIKTSQRMMATSTNMDVSIDMSADNLYILINVSGFQDPQYNPTPQVNDLCMCVCVCSGL